MTSTTRTKLGVIAVTAMMLLFLGVGVISAIQFISTGQLIPVLIGVAVLALCGVGLWFIVTELRFGFGMQSMARQLESEGGLLLDDLPKTPAGRYIREDADAEFDRVIASADPNRWQDLYRVALSYDAAGDRGRARKTMRAALHKFRASNR
ncbi:hypothetical protein [Micrococcoides hystricis]|uniref:Tetratricopeptide repeat protein n=1 Tax=Micrococcoides hystricis TaxID=1572761 RepID=A0ABV6P8L4_9MICC